MNVYQFILFKHLSHYEHMIIKMFLNDNLLFC